MKKLKLILILILIQVLFTTTSVAEQKSYGNFRNVEYVKNYDGDTCTFNINQVHPIIGEKINVRVAGIDTPEIRGKCIEEKRLALKARIVVWSNLVGAKHINLLNIKRGKYFRIVADIEVDKKDLGKLLVDKGYAVVYNGGKKTKDWCD